MNNLAKLVGGVGGGILFLSTALGSYYTIDQGERGVVTHYGAVVGLASPGLHIKMPFVTGITKVNVQTQRLGFEKTADSDARMQAYSRDQQPATITLAINYHINDPEALYTQFGSQGAFETRVIDSKALEQFKNVFGQFDAADAIQKRAILNAQVTAALQAATKGAPGVVDSVQIENISFSDQYEAAVEARMTAIVKQQQAEADKQKRMIDADAAKYEKEANADATKYAGLAEAAAISAKGEALHNNPDIVSLTAAQKWDGALPTTMVPGSTMPFLDLRH